MQNILIRCDRCGLDFESSKRHMFVDYDTANAEEITRLCEDCFVDHYLSAGYSLDQVEQLFRKISRAAAAPPQALQKIQKEITYYRTRQHNRSYLADRVVLLQVAKKPLTS